MAVSQRYDPSTRETVVTVTARKTTQYSPSVRFLIALGLLGAVMFAVPRIALPLGVILVLGALLSNKTDAAGPIKEFGHLLYGD